MCNEIESIGPFVKPIRSFPVKESFLVALGAIALAAGLMGLLGKPSLFANYLGSQKVFIPLIAGGGALFILGVTALAFRQRGNRAFEPASLWRRINLAIRLPIHAGRSAWVRNEVVEGIPVDSPWAKRTCLSGGPVDAFAKALFTSNENVQYVNMTKTPQGMWHIKEELPASECKRIVYVDFVIAGWRDHIVTIKIDNELHTIEYYDPKGLTINDRSGAIVRGTGGRLTVPQFVYQVVQKYTDQSAVYTLSENTQMDQVDSHSCGVMVSLRKCAWKNGPESRSPDDEIDAPKKPVYRKADSRQEPTYRWNFYRIIHPT